MAEPGTITFLLEFIKDWANILTPVLVAVVGFAAEKTRRETKQVRELQTKIDKAAAEKEQAYKNEISISLTNLTEEVKLARNESKEATILVKRVAEDMANENARQQDEIDKISKISEITLRCSRESAELVAVLAEGFRDNHLDGNITAAVMKYRDFENKTLTELFSKHL